MIALADYWLDRLDINEASRRHHFRKRLTSIFEAMANGDTTVYNQDPIKPDPPLIIDYASAIQGQYAPIVITDKLSWLFRTWHAEYTLGKLLTERMASTYKTNTYDDLPLEGLETKQASAVKHAIAHRLTLINGGPGTGKTFTVARLVSILRDLEPSCTIALAAPTGKAAKRMEESLRNSLSTTEIASSLPDAQTLHRLLGVGKDGVPVFHQQHYLPFDIVIVDEASMLSLDMAHALFSAVAPQARLILLGDAGQLAAVDPGAILHDLSQHPFMAGHVITLDKSSRFSDSSGIGRMANLLMQENKAHEALHLLKTSQDIIWHPQLEKDTYEQLFSPYHDYIDALTSTQNPAYLLKQFDQYRILCAGRHGVLGTHKINKAMMQLHKSRQNEPADVDVFHGMPLMITANDYRHGIFNGDIGLCLLKNEELYVYFPGLEQPILLSQINPANWQVAYALTIHKSQGSEYPHVALTMDDHFELASRELLYTGITRTRRQLDIYASKQMLEHAATNPMRRSTGLGFILDQLSN